MPKLEHVYVGNVTSYVVYFDFSQIYPLDVYVLTYWALIFRFFLTYFSA